jgi:MFS family permease
MKPKYNDWNTGNNILRALRHRNYRLYFGGQIVSLIGTWIQQLAMSWLAYRITRSPFLLGFIGFTGQIPMLLITPLAGVLADRWNRHRILILTQSLSMIQALVLSFLVLCEFINISWLIGLSLFLGLINSFDAPVRQSFVVEMVDDREDLSNAIALNSTIFNAARMLGPSVAGIMVGQVGEGICFLINGISYIAVIWALLLMRIKSEKPYQKQERHLLKELINGFEYVFSFSPIRSIVLLVCLMSMAGMSYIVIMPVFVKEVLDGGPNTQGFLLGAVGMGALVGALSLASRKKVAGLERFIPIGAGVFGLGLIGFSFVRSLEVALPLLFITGCGMIIQMASSNTIIQTVVDENKLGRVMSIYVMALLGSAPFGSLFIGSLAHLMGTPGALRVGGLICLIGAITFANQMGKFQQSVQAIYIRLGLVGERPSGTGTVVELNAEGFEDDIAKERCKP